MTNAKNVKNGQYYNKVIEELKERCSKRGEDFPFNVAQTRLKPKFKHCIKICRDAVMKVKTSSSKKRFQENKELRRWFGKLLPGIVGISSMDNCQPQQATELERKAPETNGKEANSEERHDDVCEVEASQGSSPRSSDGASNGKRKYVSKPMSKK